MVVLSATVNAGQTPMTDTIKTGTILIEEDTLMPESLQFENEPWTFYFMAGGILRELRNASGKQSKYGSEGNLAHSDKVMDHSDQPRNAGSLPKEDWKAGSCQLGAPACGGVMKLEMKIDSETQVTEEAEFQTFGCALAIASSSLPIEWVKGKTSRKRLPSRTRISSSSSAFPRATLLDATRHSRIGRRLHLVGSPTF